MERSGLGVEGKGKGIEIIAQLFFDRDLNFILLENSLKVNQLFREYSRVNNSTRLVKRSFRAVKIEFRR